MVQTLACLYCQLPKVSVYTMVVPCITTPNSTSSGKRQATGAVDYSLTKISDLHVGFSMSFVSKFSHTSTSVALQEPIRYLASSFSIPTSTR